MTLELEEEVAFAMMAGPSIGRWVKLTPGGDGGHVAVVGMAAEAMGGDPQGLRAAEA